MKKVFALALSLSFLSGLYGFTLGLGVAYEGLAVSGADPYFALKADARVPLSSMIDIRAVLLNVSLPDGGKSIHLGTFTESDLIFKPKTSMSFKPYLALGVWFSMGLEDAPLDYKILAVKGALGGEMEFGGLNAYLEAGLNKFTWVSGGGGTSHPVYVQLGVNIPVKI
jgi:hypothetical protein